MGNIYGYSAQCWIQFSAESLQEIQSIPITHGWVCFLQEVQYWHLLDECESPLRLAAI